MSLLVITLFRFSASSWLSKNGSYQYLQSQRECQQGLTCWAEAAGSVNGFPSYTVCVYCVPFTALCFHCAQGGPVCARSLSGLPPWGWGCSCYHVSVFTLLSVVPLSLAQKLFSQSSFIFQEDFSMCRYIPSVCAGGGEFGVFLTGILELVRAWNILCPESKDLPKNHGSISKGHRDWLKGVSIVPSWFNLSNKVNNDSIRL